MKEIDGIPLFAKVVELNSFAEAARRLNLPTTTVSRKIQQLESELGGKLLNRTTRSLSLTELGERVLPKAILMQDILKELTTDAEEFSSQPVGKLHISAPRALSQDLIAPLLAQFKRKYPGIKIELDAANRIQDLIKSSVDFAFRIGELSDSSLVALPLASVNYELVASREWVEQHSKVTHPSDLINCHTIRNHVDGFLLPWHFSKDGESIVHEAEANMLSDDLLVSVAYIRSGIGIGYLPVSLTKVYIESGELVTLLSDWKKQTPTVYLVYPNRQYLPQKSKLFLEFVKQNRAEFKRKLTL